MRLVIINGSPKRTGRTKEISLYFKKILKREIDIGEINLSENKLNICKGIMSCFKNGQCPLSKRDNFESIVDEILSADAILIVTPVYVHHIPSILKNLIDRMAYMEHFYPLHKKIFSIFVHANSNGAEQTQAYLEKIFICMGGHLSHSENYLSIEEETEMYNRMDKLARNTLMDIKNKNYRIHPLQNSSFKIMKKIVELEKIKGVQTYKQEKWIEFEKFEDYGEFILSG